MPIKTFKPLHPKLDKVAKDLYLKAIEHERDIAADWRDQLNNNNQNGQYNNLLSITDDWEFLRNIVDKFGTGYNSNVSLTRSKKLNPQKYNVPFKVYGKYVIQKPNGTFLAGNKLNNPSHPISPGRIQQIHGLYNYIHGWVVSRLIPVVWEEVAQEILQDYATQQYGVTGVKVEESNNWKYDFVMKFPPGTVRYTITELNGKKLPKWVPTTDWRFDYKSNLDDMHIADKELKIKDTDITSNLYDTVCMLLLKSKLEDLYPTFISLNNSGEILFSSELLQNTDDFYLTEPQLLSQAHIEDTAKKLYEDYKKKLIDHAQYGEGMKNLANQGLEEVIIKHLLKTTINGSLWYGRNGQYR